MKKHVLLFLFLLNVLGFSAMAQNRTISGRVVSAADGLALPGVSVVVKGTTIGASTDVEGRYQISVTGSPTLVFTFIGFSPREEIVGTRSIIDVRLADDAKALQEVVVTSYTTQNKREVTGSIATVKANEIASYPLGSFDQALQGKAPGILVQANSGQPGAAANVLIRGTGSLLGSNQPLYILDGVEISASDFATLNPADFESLNILKDASSTAPYGSRGANGVIVITSKRGKVGTTRINYDVQYGLSKAPENRLRVMNTQEKLDYELSQGNPYEWTDEDLARLRQINTNWEDVFFQTGKTSSHTLSASGGAGKTTYFLSGSIFDQTGTVRTTGLKRYTGRANVTSEAGNFQFGLNSTFGVSKFSGTSEANTGIAAPLNAVRWSNPYETPYDEEGNYTEIYSGQPNALQELLENSNSRRQLKGVGNVFVGYTVPFIQGLSLRTNWGGDFTANENTTFFNPTTASGSSATGGSGSFARNYGSNFRYTGTTSISFKRDIGADHTFSIGLFNEIVNNTGRNFGFTGYGLGGAFQNEAGITPGTSDNGFIPAVNGNGFENALLSYFTIVNYGFKNRYFLDLSARRDGSSRFGADRRFANFGSVGLSWIVTAEPFMEGLTNIFNELKYKISYGSAGNQNGIGNFEARELFGRAVYNGVSGLVQTQLANPELQWERKTTFNTGIELATLQGRVRSTIEYYNAVTSDLFLNRQLSRTSGYNDITTNIGELRNRGVEFSLEGDLVKTPSLTWSANVSLTYNQNEITKLIGGGQTEQIDGITINRVGEPLNTLYLVRFAGVNPVNGNAQYLTKDGEITEQYDPADRVLAGSTQVPFFGGFGSSLNFRGFEVNAFFSFVKGNKIYNNERSNIINPTYLWDNLSAELTREWKKSGDITDVPYSASEYQAEVTRLVESGDFLRLRNLNVAYNLPKHWAQSIKVQSIRVYAQGQNLKTWTKFMGWDPEITGASLIGAQYPALRTVTFGLSVGF
ncbi:SusC/RagA family TonB-linked outer membrane protein [Rufibacter roseolus]|uniref:SusC/RagA family TonB-linked outer membrane protein n=1 Tax=Rufibacter roseolus TaxID=2817375 RepID=UPI001B304139|nr:TonB-dependent receptor [Rufibacter roseolus]